MRKMRLGKREIRDMEIIRQILEECKVVRLGLCDEEGMFIIPVNFGYDIRINDGKTELALYIHGAGEGRKADLMRAGCKTAIEMDCGHELITGDYTCSYSFAYRSLMGNGLVRQLTDGQEKRYGLSRIMEHLAPGEEIDFTPEVMERTSVFRIDVTSFTGKERKRKIKS